MCSVSSRLVIVDTDLSAARIPLPVTTRAWAVSSRLYFVTSTSRSANERSVPDLHRGRVAIVAENVQGRGVQQEALTGLGRKADPPRDQNAKEVAVGEQRDVARGGANPGDHPIGPDRKSTRLNS